MASCRRLRPHGDWTAMLLKGLLVVSFSMLPVASGEGTPAAGSVLSRHLNHFEVLSYNRYAVHDYHQLQQDLASWRGPASQEHTDHMHPLRIQIHAFGRALHLVLEPNLANQIAARVTLVDKNGVRETLEDEEVRGSMYHGYVEGVEPSYVQGLIHDGLFTGVVHVGNETYHLEPSWRYFNGTDVDFHSVIYRASDVRYHVPDGRGVSKWDYGKEERAHVVGDSLEAGGSRDYRPVTRGLRSTHPLSRRALSSNRSFCLLRLAVDHRFFVMVGRSSATIVRNEIATLLSEVNEIFAKTDFDFDGHPDRIQFHVPEVEIFTSPDQPSSEFDREDLSTEELLELWADTDHDDFCLAILLTFRNFNTSLGQAFLAGPDESQVGGLCQKRQQIRGRMQSSNSAFASFGLFGIQIPDAVAIASIAHQLGHGFGAEHDPETGSCSPGVRGGGNFIMFPRATEGTLPNNLKFSNCSIKSMLEVVRTKATCFLSEKATCGNGIIEEGEECDCGATDTSVCARNDPCCSPSICKLAPGAQCSPKTGAPCCSDECQFKSSDHVCQPKGDCNLEVKCDGTSDGCPVTSDSHEPNTTFCSSSTRTCFKGRCTGSICVHLGENVTECQCVDSDENLCDICCKVDGECRSTFSLSRSRNISGTLRVPGQVCGDYRGFCDLTSPPQCLTFGSEVIFITEEEEVTVVPNVSTSTGAFIGVVAFLCVVLCVAAVVGSIIVAVLVAKNNRKKKLTATTVSYRVFKEDDPPSRGPLPPIPPIPIPPIPPIPTPASAGSPYVVPINSNPAYQVGQHNDVLPLDHTYEMMP